MSLFFWRVRVAEQAKQPPATEGSITLTRDDVIEVLFRLRYSANPFGEAAVRAWTEARPRLGYEADQFLKVAREVGDDPWRVRVDLGALDKVIADGDLDRAEGDRG